jgi:hypothetical protein
VPSAGARRDLAACVYEYGFSGLGRATTFLVLFYCVDALLETSTDLRFFFLRFKSFFHCFLPVSRRNLASLESIVQSNF